MVLEATPLAVIKNWGRIVTPKVTVRVCASSSWRKWIVVPPNKHCLEMQCRRADLCQGAKFSVDHFGARHWTHHCLRATIRARNSCVSCVKRSCSASGAKLSEITESDQGRKLLHCSVAIAERRVGHTLYCRQCGSVASSKAYPIRLTKF